MKHFSLASFSGSMILLGSSVLQNSLAASAAFVGTSNFASSRSVLSTKGSPPSISPGQPRPMTTPPTQSLLSSPPPPLTRRSYANDESSSDRDANSDSTSDSTSSSSTMPVVLVAEQRRQEWIDRSVNYYTKVMREERRRRLGQAPTAAHVTREYQADFNVLAKKHYFALRKIKDGKPHHAERIYRRIIGELQQDVDCDNAKLAVTTLLLALLLQRVGSPKQTRSVFLNFFRVAMLGHDNKDVFGANSNTNNDGHEQCACSAKVMQAYALFEMKQGNSLKSLQLVQKAVQLDPALKPVLNWKQFRDAAKAYDMYGLS